MHLWRDCNDYGKQWQLLHYISLWKKTGNGSLHFETNKHMQCIAAIACLKHAIQKLWNIQIYMRHTVGWNKHFLSANLLLRFLLCDKGNAIFISGLYVSGRLSNYERWHRPSVITVHTAAGNSCEDCFRKGCHIESNRCTWLEKRSVI